MTPARSHDPERGISRRGFLAASAGSGLALAVPIRRACGTLENNDEPFDVLSRELLRDWCDGMLARQIIAPGDPTRHGALACPACDFIHGRCMDAVYPLLHMASATGERKYLDAGVAVFEWSRHVSHDDGSWSVIADPKSWRGITVFGAIALAEALKHHGGLLDEAVRQRWMDRLGRAGDYILKSFTSIDFSNINYGCTGIHAMALLGRVLDRPAYLEKSRELAAKIPEFISKPNGLLFGEGKPARQTSVRGRIPVDLGYNVEESIIALALCADLTGDAELADTAIRLLRSHLEFMLPDGGWDNSWGTRQAKWTYWGSRTCDGCQPGYAVFADKEPAFATAVIANTRLMRACTSGGLLHGGPHCIARKVPPCIHHTFTHAKAIAALLDHGDLVRRLGSRTAALPRALADGVRPYPEVGVWLAARGPWRATIAAGDSIYAEKVQQPTGGVLSLLWHQAAGPVFAGSMARYHLVEPNNMQANPGPDDIPLTPRVELRENGSLYSQLHNLQATVEYRDQDGVIEFLVDSSLVDENRKSPPSARNSCRFTCRIEKEQLMLTAKASSRGSGRPCLVLPFISPSGEGFEHSAPNRVVIRKDSGFLEIEANVPLRIETGAAPRVFNLVPGFEALPVIGDVPDGSPLVCRIGFTTDRKNR